MIPFVRRSKPQPRPAAGAYSNILVNAHMETATVTEGAEITCFAPSRNTNFPIATGWASQQWSPDAVVKTQRVSFPGLPGVAGGAKLTVETPAAKVEGLDRLQLYQAIRWDELLGTGLLESGPSLPLHFRFAIYANIAFEVSLCINSVQVNRNITINRPVVPNQWNVIEAELPPDTGAGWLAKNGYGCFFQIGLSCGKTRLAPADAGGAWNDQHWLMLEHPTNDTFLRTEGAYAIIADPSLSTAPYQFHREPTAVGTLRSLALEEKTYEPGVRPGTPGIVGGAVTVAASATPLIADLRYRAPKTSKPGVSIYSPATGAKGFVLDITTGSDVPATALHLDQWTLQVVVPDAESGRSYQLHWLASDF